MSDTLTRERRIEILFFAVFSVLTLAIFYTVISMNGVILGNDPAVHLEKAQIFLNTGQIPLSTVSWTPPLYQIVLAMFISVSGASDIAQLIFMVKVVTVIVNWLLVMSVYLVGAKFFSRKVGVIASVLLLMCFPIFELNQWGGYTTVLGIAFLMLLLVYLPLSTVKFGYLAVTFFMAFAVVLTHQLATFLAVFILPPILLYILIKTRGASLKVLVVLLLGGGIAFFIYYFHALIGYMGEIIQIIFFSIKTYAYQIPEASFNAFVINFGFLLLFAAAGFYVAYRTLRANRHMAFFIVLLFSFLVPFFFAESYLFGFLLPFHWFIYYLTPPIAVLAAVTISFLLQKAPAYYANHRASFRKGWVKAVAVALIVVAVAAVVVRSETVYGRILEAATYYSTTDTKAYEAGIWLRDNYPQNQTVVVSEAPGFWFQEFSGKSVIAQTDQVIQRTEIAESVLSLSYEMEHPQIMMRAYEAKGAISDESYVPLDNVWNRVSYSSGSGSFLNYTQQGTSHYLPLTSLSKQIVFENQTDPKKIEFIYSNDNITLTQTVLFQNNAYPLDVTWTVTPQKSQISEVTLYISTFFDLKFTFDKAEIPGLLDWVNPYDAPTAIRTSTSDWAVASFSGENLKDRYIGLYDDANGVAYGFRFEDLPDWGNVGALPNRQIDAVRFQYDFGTLNQDEVASRSYQVLTLAKNSYPALARNNLLGLFDLEVPLFAVATRDFRDYILNHNIGFLVYDRNQLDTQMIHSRLLQLIYSNDRYAIFAIQK